MGQNISEWNCFIQNIQAVMNLALQIVTLNAESHSPRHGSRAPRGFKDD
jgi:hypothetical protein